MLVRHGLSVHQSNPPIRRRSHKPNPEQKRKKRVETPEQLEHREKILSLYTRLGSAAKVVEALKIEGIVLSASTILKKVREHNNKSIQLQFRLYRIDLYAFRRFTVDAIVHPIYDDSFINNKLFLTVVHHH
jgi:hypothetical protein